MTDHPRTATLLEILATTLPAPQLGAQGLVERVSEALGCTCAILAWSEADSAFGTAAWAAADGPSSDRWAPVLEKGILGHEGGLAGAIFLDESRVLPDQSWPRPGCPEARVLLEPLSPRDASAALVLLRASGDPPFGPEERIAARALAGLAGRELGGDSRAWETPDRESEFWPSAMRAFGRLSAEAALQALVVQARHTLAARMTLVFLAQRDDQLVLAARAGKDAPAVGLECRSDRLGDLDMIAMSGRSGPFMELPLESHEGILGILAIGWEPGFSPGPKQRALGTHVAELVSLLVSRARLERRSIESQAAERVASELARHRDAFVRQIVHDLRNSLHALGLMAEEIDLAAGDTDRVHAATAAIDRTLGFMGSYLKDTVRSLDRHHPLEHPAQADLAAALNRLAPPEGPKLDSICVRVVPCVPAIVRTSPVQLDQILELMVVEAARRAQLGGTLEVWAAVAGGWATVHVQDDGPGLDPVAWASRSQRPDRPEAPQEGLAALEVLVRAARGHFGIRSQPCEGTRLHVALPTMAWGSPTFDADGKVASPRQS